MSHVYLHASEVLTGAGVVKNDGRRPVEADLGRIEDGAIAFSEKKILWIGKSSELPQKFKKFKTTNLKNQQIILPAFVDCHTHLVFAGDRANEFARRSAGESYEKIAKEGGGILTTVNATRAASERELFNLACQRVLQSYRFGVRAIEIKSGYGLDLETEIKILNVVQKLKSKFKNKVEIFSTFLGAHAFPKSQTHDQYMKVLLDEMIPRVAKRKLADACDVFVDEGYFSISQAKAILKKAKKLGMKTKVHADELVCTGAAEFAASIGALSADHLLKISSKGIQKISKSNTVGVLLPGTAFYLKADYAPARKLIDSGAAVALSTDFNPGTCMTLSLPTIMTIAALYQRMSRAEIFAAVTYNAAKALGAEKRWGSLRVGMPSQNILKIPYKKFEEVYYRFSWSPDF